MNELQKRHKNVMAELSFAVNPDETESEGILRISKIMQRVFKYWHPKTSSNNMLNYSLARLCKARFDSISQPFLMKQVLQHEEIADIYKRINEVVETPMYRVACAMLDDGHMF